MSGIFLSYRREDASGWAGRLYEYLVRDWGVDQVFMDIDAIEPGDDFREAIAHTIETCDVVLVVIGPNWLNVRDELGNRRIEDSADTHRTEVIAALEGDVRLVPVIVGGAAMPRAVDLPDPLRELSYRNAAIIDDRRFARDVADLLASLRQYGAGDQTRSASGIASSGRNSARETRASVTGPRSGSIAGARQSMDGLGSIRALPSFLAIIGATLLLIWGLLVQREWHNEYASVRMASTVVLLALLAVAAYRREWRLVLAAGIVGLAGLSLWMLQLLTSHWEESGELFSPEQDGIPNIITFVGVLSVLAAGLAGAYPRPPR